MASKIDKVLDRLERLTDDVNEIKRKAIPLLPIPKPLKTTLRTVSKGSDDFITDNYFEAVRAIADRTLPVSSGPISSGPTRGGGTINAGEVEFLRQSDIAKRTNNQALENELADLAGTRPRNVRKVTPKMKKQRKIQSKAFKNANAKGRLQNGSFRAGYDQQRIARMAQKECTKERIRLGLCEDPKKKKGRRSKK